MAESRRALAEQVHESEDRGQKESEPREEDGVGRVVAIGVVGDDSEMCGGGVLALRVNDRPDEQDDRRRDQAEPGNEPAEATHAESPSIEASSPRCDTSVCPRRRRHKRRH